MAMHTVRHDATGGRQGTWGQSGPCTVASQRHEPTNGVRAALEAVLGYPLAPWLDDCLRAAPADAGADGGLVEIRLHWQCESLTARPGAWPWPTWIRLDVSGIGAVWPGFRPGEPHHRERVEPRRDYAIECTPLAALRPLPLRLDPEMVIMVEGPTTASPETVASLPAPETTLLDLLAALFDEFSMYGSPEARDREWAELLRDDEAPGEGKWITLQQVREALAAKRRGSA
jgi:hypothetical protein